MVSAITPIRSVMPFRQGLFSSMRTAKIARRSQQSAYLSGSNYGKEVAEKNLYSSDVYQLPLSASLKLEETYIRQYNNNYTKNPKFLPVVGKFNSFNLRRANPKKSLNNTINPYATNNDGTKSAIPVEYLSALNYNKEPTPPKSSNQDSIMQNELYNNSQPEEHYVPKLSDYKVQARLLSILGIKFNQPRVLV